MSQISTTWEALTPPDRTTITYHELDGRGRSAGTSGDRGFWFDLPQRSEPILEAGPASSLVSWELEVVLRLSQAGRTRSAMADAVANESTLLARAIEKTSSWPSNTLAVLTRGTRSERDGPDGDALIYFAINLLTSETD
jgi:hypothetical protein